MRDRRGRTGARGSWGNIVATVVPNDGYGPANSRAANTGAMAIRSPHRGYGYSEPGEFYRRHSRISRYCARSVEARICPTAFPRLSDREEAAYESAIR